MINKKFIRIFIIFILISITIIISYGLYSNYFSNENSADIDVALDEDNSLIDINKYSELKEIYEKNKLINNDYIGQIYFDSGLINLPFVQGETNDTYLRTDWESGEYDIGGSIFLDSSNDITTDQNIILYGHSFPKTYENYLYKMFTPLLSLMNRDYYEDNKIINLFLGTKILKYEIVSIFRVGVLEEDGIQYIGDNEPIYVLRNYSKDEFDDYISKIKERQYYDTGVLVESDDSLLTLQTCFEDNIDKLVVLAKLIEEIPIE